MYKHKFETIKLRFNDDDETIIKKLNEFSKHNWEIVEIQRFNNEKYKGSGIIDEYYVKFLLKRNKNKFI